MDKIFSLFRTKPKVAVVRLTGVIATGSRLGGSSLSDASTAVVLERAFRSRKNKAVALVINSPGGSPVQSALIAARIQRLSQETKTPVYAFCEDVAASGGYWLATAADKIFVDESSVIGSIGVISASFGFHELLEKQGVERRVHTAGEDKSMLDPFRPERQEDIIRLKALQSKIHKNFIRQVTSRRGARLVDENLFTGEIWVGSDAVAKGLADGIGHLVPTLKSIFGDKTRFQVFGQRRSLLQRFGGGVSADLVAVMEDRALWSRFGG